MRGADIVIKCLENEGVEVVFGYPGGASMELHQSLTRSKKIRTILPRHEQGERVRRRSLCARQRQDRRVPRHQRARRDQSGHRHRRRVHGFRADGGHHRASAPSDDRQGRVPGNRHIRDDPAVRQAQLPRDERGGHPARHQRGVLHRLHGAARPGGDRYTEGRSAEQLPAGVPRQGEPARLQSGPENQRHRRQRDRGTDREERATRHLLRRRHHFGQRQRRVASRLRRKPTSPSPRRSWASARFRPNIRCRCAGSACTAPFTPTMRSINPICCWRSASASTTA